VPKRALGKGLDALIPQSVLESMSSEKVAQIPVDKIGSNPHQPRKSFDKESLKELAQSIKTDGLLQPVVLRKKEGIYELILGERRLMAARLAGLKTIPAIIKAVDEADSLRLALVENLQRENLNPIDVARAYKSLIETFGLSQEEMAGMIGKSRSSVANTIRLLALPERIQSYLFENKLTEGHARALLTLTTAAEQLALAQRIIEYGLSVRDVEAEAGAGRKKTRNRPEERVKPPHITYLENALAQYLATRVTIEEKRGGKGRLIIEFYSHDDFERLSSLMQLPLPR
jgi:ParB family chromosome partitioning protein